MNAQQIAVKMNKKANALRRDEGTAPFFENHLVAKIAGSVMHFEYKGFFDHAEATDNNCVKVHYQHEHGYLTSTNFRVDQMKGYRLA